VAKLIWPCNIRPIHKLPWICLTPANLEIGDTAGSQVWGVCEGLRYFFGFGLTYL